MLSDAAALAWTERYLFIPFRDEGRSFRGADCYGLYWLAWKSERGIELPDALIYGHTTIGNTPALNKAIESKIDRFAAVDNPAPFAAVLFRSDGLPVHIGLCLGQGLFMHTRASTGVVLDNLNSRQWAKRIEGFYAPL
jgi:cell wall-associated NlpC family hydrolase